MANKTTLNIASNIDEMRRKNNMGEYQKEEQEEKTFEATRNERVGVAPKKTVGRPKNKRALINKISKTSYFDDGTHQRIKQLQVFSKVEVKDLILVSVIDFLDRNCDESGKLTAAGEQHIVSVMDKVYEEYGEYLD